MSLKKVIVLAILLIFAGSFLASAADQNGSSGESLLVYSGAGLKAPMQEIGWLFENQTGTKVELTYAGSGALISQMNLTHKGDVFIPGGTEEYKNAQKRGLVNEDYSLVAYHVPIIVVQKGNPKNIKSLEDFAQSGLKVALADANATAIGRSADQMFTNLKIMDAVNENTVVRTATVNELLTAMTMGQADAAVITKDQVKGDKLEKIDIPNDQNKILITTIGTTTFSKNPDLAEKFVKLVSSDEGKNVFKKFGFPSYPDPAYGEASA